MTQNGFVQTKKNGVVVLQIPSFLENGFQRHCFTTRLGGVSPKPYDTLNLSITRESNPRNKEENYRRVCGVIGVPYNALTLVNYEHGNGVHCVEAAEAGTGITKEQAFPHCDALLTNAPDVAAVTLHADCVPLFMADKATRAVGVGHAGWKGVSLKLAQRMVRNMRERYGGDPANILVGIGPHIGVCCFEVQEDVAQKFAGYGGAVTKAGDRFHVNLQSVLLEQLKECGVPEGNITCANLCTYCEEKLFYSHRRDQGKTGAMGSFVCNL